MASWQGSEPPGPDRVTLRDFVPIVAVALLVVVVYLAHLTGWVPPFVAGAATLAVFVVVAWIAFAQRVREEREEDRRHEQRLCRVLAWPSQEDDDLFTEGELRLLEDIGIRQIRPGVFVRGGSARQ